MEDSSNNLLIKLQRYIPTNKILCAFIALSALFILIGLVYPSVFERGNEVLTGRAELSLVQIEDQDWFFDEKQLNSNPLIALPGQYINLGLRDSVWLKVSYNSNKHAESKLGGLILLIKSNNISTDAELVYLSINQGWQTKHLQAAVEFPNRLLINLPKDIDGSSFYLKLNGRYLRASVYILEHSEFFEELQKSALMSGVYFGLLLLFILYNLMLFLRFNEPSYGAYSAMLSVLLLWFCSAQGWLAFLFPSLPILHKQTVSLGLLLVVTSAEFAKHFLQIKSQSIRLNNVISVMQWMLVFLFVSKLLLSDLVTPLLYQISYSAALVTSLLVIGCCFWGAILGIKKRQAAAWNYLVATILFSTVAMLMALSAANLINLSFSWEFLQLASTIEIIIFSAGLVAIMHQQQQEKIMVEAELACTQEKLIRQLEISNSLKDNIIGSASDPKLFPELAKLTKILNDIRYVQADGNTCTVVYKSANQTRKISLDCTLQNLSDSFGSKCFTRVHKSYLINSQQTFSLQRRTSADYDLDLHGHVIPIGRKYFSYVKSMK